MQAEFRYFKNIYDAYNKKFWYFAIPVDLDRFEIVEKIEIHNNDSSATLSSVVGGAIPGLEDRFFLIYQWDKFYKRWIGQRACFSYVREMVCEQEEVADLTLLITEGIPKLEVEIPE